jgi:hypothetical protein
MSRESRRQVGGRRQAAAVVGGLVLAAVMWYAAASYLTAGLLDVAVFAPPGAALGLVATWSAHTFAPRHFSWRRGMIGATIGALIAGPFMEFLVTLAAAWNPDAFHVVFTTGASAALAGGLVVGGLAWLVKAIGRWHHKRRATVWVLAARAARRRKGRSDAAMPSERGHTLAG